MTERIIPSDVISFVEELRKDRANNAEFWHDRANKATNDQHTLLIWLTLMPWQILRLFIVW
jgi:hypothetical protein